MFLNFNNKLVLATGQVGDFESLDPIVHVHRLETFHLWNFNDGKLVSGLSKKDNSLFCKYVSK